MNRNKGGGGVVERLRLYYLIEQVRRTMDATAHSATQLSQAETIAIARAASEIHDLQWLMAKYLKTDRNKHWLQ